MGGALIPLIVGYLTLHYSWRHGFIVAGIIVILISVFLLWRLPSTPDAMGLPSIGQWRHDPLELAQEKEGQDLPWRQILRDYVFYNKYLWLLAMSYALVYLVRTAINDWGNLYLSERYHYDLVSANSALSLFEIGGFVGSLVAGWGSDKLFSSNRGPMALVFAIGTFLFDYRALADAKRKHAITVWLIFLCRLFCVWSANVNRHGCCGMCPQKNRRHRHGFCWLVCLSGGSPRWLPTGTHHTNVSLDRFFCRNFLLCICYCVTATAFFKSTAKSIALLNENVRLKSV